MPQDPRFIPTGEASRRTSIAEDTLRYWRWSGNYPEGFPPAIKLGRRVMFESAAIEKWLEDHIALASP